MITGSNPEWSDKCCIDKHPDYIPVMYRAACVRYSFTWLGGKQFPLYNSLAATSVGNVCGDSSPLQTTFIIVIWGLIHASTSLINYRCVKCRLYTCKNIEVWLFVACKLYTLTSKSLWNRPLVFLWLILFWLCIVNSYIFCYIIIILQ